MKRVSWMVMLVVIALIAAACGGQAATTGDANSSASGGSPADTQWGFASGYGQKLYHRRLYRRRGYFQLCLQQYGRSPADRHVERDEFNGGQP